jgi:N-acetylmuramoyl-L-alanine amidase
MAKVILDAGHGGPEPGAIYEGRQEKDDNLRLALAVGEILEQNGVEVAYTRTEDVYDTPFEKAQIANREGGDFLISFHRNSSPEANQYSGVETLVYDKSGDKVTLAENINEELEDVGYRNLGVKERPGLVILKRSQMPAVLVETGFLNTEADNALFDEQFDAIAQAIAEAVLDTVGERPDWMMEDEVMQNVVGESDQMMNDAPVQIKEKFYRVQTGAFKNRQYAEDMLYQLLKENYPAFLLYEAP